MTTRETTPRFVAEISLGNALLIATLLCGFVGHFVEVTIAGSQNTKDVEKLQAPTTGQITDVKSDLARQISALHLVIRVSGAGVLHGAAPISTVELPPLNRTRGATLRT
jgi:hypothetical protein